MARNVFITGATGYLGRRLASQLLQRGHSVRALLRRGSEGRLPEGCEPIFGDALQATTFASQVAPSDTFVQLGWRAEAVPIEGGTVSCHRSRVGSGIRFSRKQRRNPPFRLCQCRPSCASHAGLHRGPRGGRESHSRCGPRFDHTAALVRSRAGTPMALFAAPDLRSV